MNLNSLAIAGSDAVGGGRVATIVRYLDLPLLALALIIFVVADLPMLGFGVLAGVWLAGAIIEGYGYRRSQRELGEGNRRQAMGWVSATSLGRVYMVTTAVLLVGLLGDREDGLAAAVLAVVLFTVHFLCRFVANKLEDGAPGEAAR